MYYDMTPKIRTLISGVIFMTKYTKEIKLTIYHEWVDDDRRGAYLSRKYGMRPGEIAYMGYRRIYGQLRREDYEVNHKKVQRLMQKMGLFAISIRKKRKYSSYYGVQGKIKPDLIKRKFYAIIPNRHWFTDVTEFHLKDQKLYFSRYREVCQGFK